jgi:flavin reductase (DIM6/NTAB) family NADH-FMN oxidoreductase RutF
MSGNAASKQVSDQKEFDSRTFRAVLGCFATGITIITTVDKAGTPVGFTANSFTSLSLDPPLVLFCLDRKIASFDAFHSNRHFAINVLRHDQEDLSRRFATSQTDKFNGLEFETWATGCPILKGCLAAFECDIQQVIEAGDHVIIIGEVNKIRHDADGGRPLLYYRGKYSQIAAQ